MCLCISSFRFYCSMICSNQLNRQILRIVVCIRTGNYRFYLSVIGYLIRNVLNLQLRCRRINIEALFRIPLCLVSNHIPHCKLEGIQGISGIRDRRCMPVPILLPATDRWSGCFCTISGRRHSYIHQIRIKVMLRDCNRCGSGCIIIVSVSCIPVVIADRNHRYRLIDRKCFRCRSSCCIFYALCRVTGHIRIPDSKGIITVCLIGNDGCPYSIILIATAVLSAPV